MTSLAAAGEGTSRRGVRAGGRWGTVNGEGGGEPAADEQDRSIGGLIKTELYEA